MYHIILLYLSLLSYHELPFKISQHDIQVIYDIIDLDSMY